MILSHTNIKSQFSASYISYMCTLYCAQDLLHTMWTVHWLLLPHPVEILIEETEVERSIAAECCTQSGLVMGEQKPGWKNRLNNQGLQNVLKQESTIGRRVGCCDKLACLSEADYHYQSDWWHYNQATGRTLAVAGSNTTV